MQGKTHAIAQDGSVWQIQHRSGGWPEGQVQLLEFFRYRFLNRSTERATLSTKPIRVSETASAAPAAPAAPAVDTARRQGAGVGAGAGAGRQLDSSKADEPNDEDLPVEDVEPEHYCLDIACSNWHTLLLLSNGEVCSTGVPAMVSVYDS